MKLVIVTQKVDRNDPILGFFHRWLEEFAMHCERVDVIALSVGEHALPSNVCIHSLRKEHGSSKWMQVIRFWRLLRWRSKDADALLVHMTPIWIVLAWPILLFRRIPSYLWYEARGGGWPLTVAIRMVRKVFSASKSGMPVATSKSVIVGHGIDTAMFVPDVAKRDQTLLSTVGRITKSKNLPAIVEALAMLPAEFRLRIAGVPVTGADNVLLTDLREQLVAFNVQGRTEIGSVSREEVVTLLQRSMIFLHAASTSLDKALLEAMACGCLVVSSSQAALDTLPTRCIAAPGELAARAKALLDLPVIEQDALRHELRQIIVQYHALPRLILRLLEEMRMR
jgi:glycosyltransferase involved in cell wall biosynthesis